MKILAIDTSSQNCSIAIVEAFSPSAAYSSNNFSVIAFKNSNDEKTHSQKLMPMLSQMFEENNLSLKDINVLSCALGPGSFTGIRIGLATVKAFCDSQNIPIVGITSLESLAYNVSDNGLIFPIIDAKNENIYSAAFQCNEQAYKLKINEFADNINNALNKFINIATLDVPIYFVGNGSIIYKDLIEKTFNGFPIHFSNSNEQSAISLAKCAFVKYCNGEYGDSNSVSPVYLRKSQAERIADGEPI